MSNIVYVKLGLFGDSSVGKSTIIKMYENPKYDISNITSTIGIDYVLKKYEFEKYIIKLQIWDTAGSEKFFSMTQSYYRDIFCPIFFFSLNDYQSFKNIKNWLIRYNNYNTGYPYKMFLIGNKSDLDILVQKEEIDNLCKEKFLIYKEINYNKIKEINEIFEEIANNCYCELDKDSTFTHTGIRNTILNNNSKDTNKNKQTCC